jgi:hypothetical protein
MYHELFRNNPMLLYNFVLTGTLFPYLHMFVQIVGDLFEDVHNQYQVLSGNALMLSQILVNS